MSKHKQAGKEKDPKEKDKGVQLVIRIAKSERAAFVALCEDLDTTAAREIRRFMREFVAARSPVSAPDGTPSDAPVAAEPASAAVAAASPTPVEVAAQPAAATPAQDTAPTDASPVDTAADDADMPKKTRKRIKP